MATYWEWKRLFIMIYKESTPLNNNNTNAKDPPETNSEEKPKRVISIKNMAFLNLHIGEHWFNYIQLFGVPSEYSTQHWEALHQKVKRKEKSSNHLHPSDDISRQIIEETTLYHCFGDIEVLFANL